MAAIRRRGELFLSVDALSGSNAENDMIYDEFDVERLRKFLKEKGNKIITTKYGSPGDPFWVVYKKV